MQERLFVDPLSFKKLPHLDCHCLTLLSLHFHPNKNIGEISIAFFKSMLSIQLVQGFSKKTFKALPYIKSHAH